MKLFNCALLMLLALCFVPLTAADVKLASKKFTESVILGEIGRAAIAESGVEAEHRRELGGTRVIWNALLRGDIDAYPEYSGTIMREILAKHQINDPRLLDSVLAEYGVAKSAPLGFNNTYALGLRRARAAELGLNNISDLSDHPQLALGFSNEFMDRGDGWPGLQAEYNLPQDDVRGLDHDLAYRGIADGSIDVIDVYSTDAEIRYYDLLTLVDDRHYFPEYQAVWLYREDLRQRYPAAVAALKQFEGAIPADTMIAMNAAVKIDRRPEGAVAAEFAATVLQTEVRAQTRSFWGQLWNATLEHIFMVFISMFAAVLLAVPLGIAAAKNQRLGQVLLALVGVVQTIPSLALLVFMIPLLGIGTTPAIAALFLYSLLPIVRNTHAGLTDIAPDIRESALALGLPARERLLQIELPLAARSILAGIKTSAVINIGTATLGALIGAGGYGQAILTGIRLDDMALIFSGALPAAGLALLAQLLFEWLERLVIPRGIAA